MQERALSEQQDTLKPRILLCLILLSTSFFLNACGVLPGKSGKSARTPSPAASAPAFARNLEASAQGKEVVFYALGLIGTGYRFGGKNPSAGLDCSGMVHYIYREAARYPLSGSAADMAKKGRAVRPEAIRPGDLVFFNTQNRPRSHVGIYIGDLRFVHAPSSNGQVRIDSLQDSYYRTRFEEARSYLN
ncbi:MAG: C40 family peptidase [Zoogloeaceae bacterium]|jgi:cell wall-associated NlpC family hydrolase|nr:C40 family peptidase [Zoogloeaceae bacterium]